MSLPPSESLPIPLLIVGDEEAESETSPMSSPAAIWYRMILPSPAGGPAAKADGLEPLGCGVAAADVTAG